MANKLPVTGSHRGYLRTLAITFGGVLFLVGVLNWGVDPYGVYRGFNEGGLLTPYQFRGSRAAKAELVERSECEIALLGSSRVLGGYNPLSPAFEGARVCNVGLSATGLAEASHVLNRVLTRPTLREVILFVDEHMFSGQRVLRDSFYKSRFAPEKNRFEYYFDSLISNHATSASLRVLTNFVGKRPQLIDVLGFRHSRFRGTTRRRFATSLEGLNWFVAKTGKQAGCDPQNYALLRDMVRRCEQHHAAVTIAINPTHALTLEAIYRSGGGPVFEQWKRELADVAADARIPFWDFTGYDRYSTERMPQDPKERDGMQWFFENSHFKPALGDRVILTLRGQAPEEERLGVRLTPADMDQHFARFRAARALWLAQEPADIAWLESVMPGCREKSNATRVAQASRSRMH